MHVSAEDVKSQQQRESPQEQPHTSKKIKVSLEKDIEKNEVSEHVPNNKAYRPEPIMLTPPKHIKELENAGGASNANKAEMPITPKDCQEKHAGPFIGRRVARLPAPCQEK